MLHIKFYEKGNFGGLRQGITSLVLSQETSINNCVGHEMSLQFSSGLLRELGSH